MCLWKPCTFEWQNLEQRTSDLLYKNPYFFVITRPNQMESSLKCREIVIFSLHEIILWFTHYFESYSCGKSDCNFFWDIWYCVNCSPHRVNISEHLVHKGLQIFTCILLFPYILHFSDTRKRDFRNALGCTYMIHVHCMIKEDKSLENWDAW